MIFDTWIVVDKNRKLFFAKSDWTANEFYAREDTNIRQFNSFGQIQDTVYPGSTIFNTITECPDG